MGLQKETEGERAMEREREGVMGSVLSSEYVAHVRQSMPPPGLGVKMKDLGTYQADPSSLGSEKGHRTH